MRSSREVLGKGLEHIVYQSKNPDKIIKVGRLDWIAAEQILGINARSRTISNVTLFQEYFNGFALDTSLRTLDAVYFPGLKRSLLPNRQFIIQDELKGYNPLEGSLTNLEYCYDQLNEIAKQNSLMYEETGFTLDLFSSQHLLPTIYKFMTDKNYWGFPNLFVKDHEIKISDFGLFQIKDPKNPIDFIALLNLGTWTRLMGDRIGINFLPKK